MLGLWLVLSCTGEGEDSGDTTPAPTETGTPHTEDTSVEDTQDTVTPPDSDSAEPPPPEPTGWVVLQAVTLDGLSLGEDLVINGQLDGLDGWTDYGDGWVTDETTWVSKPGSARATAADATTVNGGRQTIELGGSTTPLVARAWSRADGVSGANPNDYSLYLDFASPDDDLVQTEILQFSPGTGDWEQVEAVILPEEPFGRVRLYSMFRYHEGTAWFDDVGLTEVQDALARFDGELAVLDGSGRPESTEQLALSSDDGRLSLTLDAPGAVVAALAVDGVSLSGAVEPGATGLFVRDQAAASDWVHFGGELAVAGDGVGHAGEATTLGVGLEAAWTAHDGHIEVSGTVTDLSNTDRALTVYLALPAGTGDGRWWQDLDDDRDLAGGGTFENLRSIGSTEPVGARGAKGRWPLGGVGRADAGLGVGWRPDDPQYARTAFHADTGQLVIAADVATLAGGAADFRFLVFPASPEHGLRGLVQAWYDALPELFERRVDAGGLWVAFDDLSGLTDPQDFGLRFHEISDSRVDDPSYTAWDDGQDILSFRYLYEPGMDPIELPEGTATDDPSEVLATIEALYAAGESSNEVEARGVLTSVALDRDGAPRMEVLTGKSWCPEPCARFFVNADPELDGGAYGVNWTTDHWSADAQADHASTEHDLDGEYIDSLTTRAEVLNYDPDHFATHDHPLLYAQGVWEPAILSAWSNLEGIQHVFEGFETDGRLRMANLDLSTFGFYAHALDVMGVEHGWRDDDSAYERVEDSHMGLLRALAGPRPFGFLNNIDLGTLNEAEVGSYLEACLFWGVYGSFFDDLGGGGNYWTRSELTEAHRSVFAERVPWIQALDAAGWQPLTLVDAPEGLRVERYGTGPYYLTFYVEEALTSPTTVTIDAADWGEASLSTSDFFAPRWSSLVVHETGAVVRLDIALDAGQTAAMRFDP